MERQVRTVLDNFGLIVVGYSGGDTSIMKLLEQVSENNGFYWCYVKGYPPDADVLELVQSKNGKLVEIIGFDDMMKQISDITNFSIDDLLKSFEQRQEKLKGLLIEFDQEYTQNSLNQYAEELKEIRKDKTNKILTPKDLLILANEARDKEDFVSAEKYLRDAIKIDPNDATVYNNLGFLLAKNESSWKEAEKNYRKAIELNPQYHYPYNNLGMLLSKFESRWNEAEKNYRKAIKLNPQDANVYSNYGNLLYRQNEVERAINAFQTAASLKENNAIPFVRLAGIHKKRGNQKKIKEYMEKAFVVVKGKDYYGLALINSILDNKERAFKFLKLAVDNHSQLNLLAKTDPDFEWICDDERFWEIVGRDDEK